MRFIVPLVSRPVPFRHDTHSKVEALQGVEPAEGPWEQLCGNGSHFLPHIRNLLCNGFLGRRVLPAILAGRQAASHALDEDVEVTRGELLLGRLELLDKVPSYVRLEAEGLLGNSDAPY